MEMTFKLQVFEGPLDLLLHLIDINKIDIYDIPIALITDQYLSYIQEMQLEDMDVTSDFLVMAATLLRIKSQMLLPVENKEIEESGEDPRLELVNRLLEYKMYKYIGQELKDRAFLASQSLYKPMTIPDDMVYVEPPVDLDALVGDMTLASLHKIFQSVMKRQFDKIDPIRSKYGRIEQEPVNLTDKMTDIRQAIVCQKEPVSFRGLLTKQSTKEEVIVTFLAVLELMKDGSITITQEALFDDIYISSGKISADQNEEAAEGIE
jgi:segregation and condensation protein A